MATTNDRHIIPGSERSVMPGAKAVGDVMPDERFEVTLRLRSKAPLSGLADGGAHDDRLPGQRQYLSREAYAAKHGADPQDIAKIEEFAGQPTRCGRVESCATQRRAVRHDPDP